jgi:hypothetical protein
MRSSRTGSRLGRFNFAPRIRRTDVRPTCTYAQTIANCITASGYGSVLQQARRRCSGVIHPHGEQRLGDAVFEFGAALHLDPAASLITGQTLLIDGGWTAR